MFDQQRRLLWILRHAKAKDDPPSGGADHDRALAPRGRHDARALARRIGQPGDRFGLQSNQLPQVVLCSTSERTRETASLALARCHPEPEIRYLRALYGASVEQVVEEVAKVDPGVSSIMVVGHNPGFEDLVGRLSAKALDPVDADAMKGPVGLQRRSITPFPPCALAVFAFPGLRSWAEALTSPTLLGVFQPPY